MNEVYEYYPKEEYNIFVESDKIAIQKALEGKSVVNWSQMRIGDSDYYKLAHYSPLKAGDKQFLVICKIEDLNDIKEKK